MFGFLCPLFHMEHCPTWMSHPSLCSRPSKFSAAELFHRRSSPGVERRGRGDTFSAVAVPLCIFAGSPLYLQPGAVLPKRGTRTANQIVPDVFGANMPKLWSLKNVGQFKNGAM
jgi:hypothetical protein